MNHKRNIPFKNRRYYDFKKPVFDAVVKPTKFNHSIKLERFEDVAEHLGFGFVIVVHIDSRIYSIEGERIFYNKTIKRNGYFVDVEPTEYYRDSERKISMNGSYYHGFHYFKTYNEAVKIYELLFNKYNAEICMASIYTSNARGSMFDTETHVTTKIYIHKK